MKILIVSATSFEISSILKKLDEEGTKKSFFEYEFDGHNIFPLVTGIGAMKTAFGIARMCINKEFDFAINLGIAGTNQGTFNLGEVVEVISDRFADLGIEEHNGKFTDLYELELENPNTSPFHEGVLYNKEGVSRLFPLANAITVNTTHGSAESIYKINEKYDFEIESMEGAAFFYACKIIDMPGVQLRAISNYLEPRNKDNWAIGKALEKLHDAFFQYLSDSSSLV